MNKEYRDMTAEERLRVINAALNKDGFVELKKIMDEFEMVLVIPEKSEHNMNRESINQIRKIINNEGLAGFAEHSNDVPQYPSEIQTINPNNSNLDQGSIYAAEHRVEAMAENGIGLEIEKKELEQPKARVLERGSSAPNPWGDAEIVTPGQLKL